MGKRGSTLKAFMTAAALAGAGLIPSPSPAAQDLLVGGGSVTGVYYQAALQICSLLNRHSADKYHCVGRPALGSVFNVNAVDRGLLDFGVVQSDKNHQAAKGEADWGGRPVVALRSLFSLHPETVLAVTRADTGIARIEDLRGRRVNIGNRGSGQRGNAEDVLRLYRLDPDQDIQAEELQQAEASRALVDGKIDAFFYTVGNPSAAVEEPANATKIRILNVNSGAIKEFVADRPFYVMAAIPPGVYPGVDQPVETFAVTATVVTSDAVAEQTVYDLVKVVFENLGEIQGSHPVFRHLDPKAMLRGLSAPLHPGAAKYYKEKGWM